MTKHEKYYRTIISCNEAMEKPVSDKEIISDTAYALNLYNKASTYEKLGFLYLARRCCKEVLTIEPHHIEAKKYLKTYEKIQEKYQLETMRSSVKQFITFEGLQNKDTKISILKEIEQIEYGTLVKKLANKKTVEEVKSLVIILNDLGYLSTNLGDLSGTKEGELNVKLKYYTDAAVFYQYVITILKKMLNETTPEDMTAFITNHQLNPKKQLSRLQKLIFLAIGGARETIPFVRQFKDYKQSLKTIRTDIDQKLQRAENTRNQAINTQEEERNCQRSNVEEIRSLFKSTADYMQKFLGKLYEDSELEIGAPPCKYAVIGLGSMALRQMTPYSDLEFAILTENEVYKQSKDPKIKEYFVNLTHLVNFKIITLGESVIHTSRYNVDMNHLVHRGVNSDIGGKTPLGRDDKKYNLVQTIDGMLAYVRNENDWAEHIDKNLPYILQNVCFVHGDKQFVTIFKEEVTKFLTSKNESDEHSRLNCEIRALKLLDEGTVEIDYLQIAPSLKFKETPFKGDIHKLEPILGDINAGRLFDVKQEIYRLPDRLVYNLGLYYGIEGDSNWDIVDKLKDQNVITPEAAFNLKNAVTFAATLRLKTYSCHKAQKEDISIYLKPAETKPEISKQAQQIFHFSADDLTEQGGLFQYFYIALPLHETLKAFCAYYKLMDNVDRRFFFQGSDFYVDDDANKGLIYYRLAKYNEAQKYIEQALIEPKLYKRLTLQNFLGVIYYLVNDYDRAIELFDNCLKNLKLTYNEEPHPEVAKSLDNLGLAYGAKGQYDQAAEFFEDSLKMRKLITREKPCAKVADTLSNLGSVYLAKGNYDQANIYFEDSRKMRKGIYKKETNHDIARSLNDLGVAFYLKGHYDQAIMRYQDSLNMMKLIYKEEPHPDVAESLNKLGIAYSNKGQYDQAIKFHEESLKMLKQIYKEEPHPGVAMSFNNLGAAYFRKGHNDQAVKYYKEDLEMKKLIYNEEPHPNVAISLNNLGLTFYKKRQYDQAIEYFEESLKMMQLIFKEEPHPNVAGTLNNLGLTYGTKGQYDKAIVYFEDSLNTMKLVYKEEPYPDVAEVLHNLGLTFYKKRQYDDAIRYYEDSLKMMKLIYKEETHPDVAKCLNNLGNAYKANDQYDEAIKNYEDSLKMMKLIYKEETHPDVVNYLNNLGNAYKANKQYDKAIKYYEDSLKMMKLIYNEETHLDVAKCLNNLGNAYKAKEQYNEAINYYEDSLKIMKLIYKKKAHLDVIKCLNNLGNAYKAKEQYDEAIKYYEDSLKMMKLIYKEETHLNVVKCLNNLGNAYKAKEKYDEAIKYYEDSLKMMKLIYKGETHPDVAKCLNNLGNAYKAKEQYEQAITYGNQALKMISIFKDRPFVSLIKIDVLNTYLLYVKSYSLDSKEIFDKLIELTGESYHNIELWRAVEESDLHKMQELIIDGVDLDNMPFMTNTTPLIRAIVKGDVEMVNLILENANINKPDNDGNRACPLYYSLGYGGQPVNLEIVKLLLEKGADVSLAMYDGDTPMHMAHYEGNKEAIMLLLSYKADINVKNDEGKTPLHCLLEKDILSIKTKLEIIRELYQISDDKTIKDQKDNVVIDSSLYHSLKLELVFNSNEVVESKLTTN